MHFICGLAVYGMQRKVRGATKGARRDERCAEQPRDVEQPEPTYCTTEAEVLLSFAKNFLFAKGCSGRRDAAVPRQAHLTKGCRTTKANLLPNRSRKNNSNLSPTEVCCQPKFEPPADLASHARLLHNLFTEGAPETLEIEKNITREHRKLGRLSTTPIEDLDHPASYRTDD